MLSRKTMFPILQGRAALRRLIWVCLLCLLELPAAVGQVLSAVEVDFVGGVPVIRIRLTGPVQVMSASPPDRGQIVDIFFRLSAQDVPTSPAVQETLSSRARGDVPAFTVISPLQANTLIRRLQVQFDHPVAYTVRTSEDNRFIELYLSLPESKPSPPTPPSTPAAPSGGAVAAPPPAAAAPVPSPPATGAAPVPVPSPPSAGAPPNPAPPPPSTVSGPGAQPGAAAAPPPVEYPAGSQFAVNLQTVPLSGMSALRPVPADLEDYIAFTSQSFRNGALQIELNIGYFKTAAEAEAVRQRALARFPEASVIDLQQRKEDSLRRAAAAAAARSTAPATAPAPAAAPGPSAPPAAAVLPVPPVPSAPSAAVPVPAAPSAAVPVPSAPSAAPAAPAPPVSPAAAAPVPAAPPPAAAPPVMAPPSEATAPPVTAAPSAAAPPAGAPPGGAGQEASPPAAAAPSPAPSAEVPPAEAAAASSEVETRASELMTQARDALAGGHNDEAINLLNQVLILPPNRSSQDAQELIGVARERAGELAQARAEYELYLKLFPTGEGADRVRQRLGALPPAPAAPAPGAAPGEAPAMAVGPPPLPPVPPGGRGLQVNGSLSQYYYGGNAKTDTLINVPTGADRTTLSGATQSAIVTNVDIAARYRTDDTETRFTFRDTNSHSFLQDVSSSNLFNVGNVEFRDFPYNYTVRLGRLAGGTTGVLGRFDGADLTWGFAPKWRFNAAAGSPVNYLTNARGALIATGIESDELFPSFGGSLYAINQTTQGYVDRRAVGTELRYFNGGASVFSNLDYDVAFRAFNIVTVQGTYLTAGQTTFTALWDERKAPPLMLSNALIGQPYTSVRDMIQQLNLTVDDARNLALDTSALSKQGMIGVSQPLSPRWQVGLDLRYANVGALPAIPDLNIPAQPSTGNQYTANLTASGSNLYSSHDINTFVVTYLNSSLEKGQQFAYNNVNFFADNKATFEPSFRYYHQIDNEGNRTDRYSPGLRVSYRINLSVTIEATVLAELSRTNGPTQSVNTSNYFYFFGYRYDLR